MEYRLAKAEDDREVVELWCDLMEFYGEHLSHYGDGIDRDLLIKSFHHMLEEDSFSILVGVDTCVVATCTLHSNHYSSWSHRYYGTLEDFIVHQEKRGQGIGTDLLTYSIKEAKRLGLSRIELQVLSHNHGARALYRKKGFSGNDSLVYTIMLEKGEA